MALQKTVALIGNPNCGKTTIFNALTGAHQYVGNWPGVTVERKSGYFETDGVKVEVVDLPGVYSLSVVSSASQDERVTRDYLLFHKPDLVVNILDASNLERNLYMTVQLFEMHLPVLLVLNMMDTAAAMKVKVDVLALAHLFNVPVVPMVASKTKGIAELKKQIVRADIKIDNDFAVSYCPHIESGVAEMMPFVQKTADDADTMISDGRYGFITEISKKLITRSDRLSKTATELIDRVALGKYTGVPLFFFVMYLMFLWTITLGNMLIDPISTFGDEYLVAGSAARLSAMNAPEWLILLLSEGVGRGVGTVATFIPPIGFLFLFLSALEDSGYMARGAFVMDRLMRGFNLPGTAFVPMIVAFGCTVPAVMGTRILASKRDRLITLMMVPFMSCGARLPVYALFATAFFPENGADVVFGLYLIGVFMAICTGLLFKSTLFKGKPVPLILEMPPYHLPTLKNMAVRTWDRLHGFIVRAGVLIVPLVIVLNLLNAVDFQGDFIPDQPQSSVLSAIGKVFTPLFVPLGISANNWAATVGLFTGLMAKEAVIGTLDALYASVAAGATAVDRLAVLFDGQIGAFAYLLFILLYTPCTSALGAIAKEFSLRWAAFVAVWTAGQAYLLSTLFYQCATMNRHAAQSLTWIAGIACAELLIYTALRFAGKRGEYDSV